MLPLQTPLFKTTTTRRLQKIIRFLQLYAAVNKANIREGIWAMTQVQTNDLQIMQLCQVWITQSSSTSPYPDSHLQPLLSAVTVNQISSPKLQANLARQRKQCHILGESVSHNSGVIYAEWNPYTSFWSWWGTGVYFTRQTVLATAQSWGGLLFMDHFTGLHPTTIAF